MLKKTAGRKKIEIKKIENTQALSIAFSRRRKSVFKKASELSTLCGAQTGVVVFSPGDKPFSFGQPSVSAVVDRYLNGNNPPQDLSRFEAYRKARIQKFNEQGGVVQDQFESAVKRCDALTKIKEQNQKEFRLPSEEEGSSFEELQKELEKMDGMTTNMICMDLLVHRVQSVANRSSKPTIGYSSSAIATNPLGLVSPSDPYEIARSA
uniref:MADS-box protein AGL73 n=1 Tax=Aquilegia coerulea TaxID=218851 RepID=K7XJ83_AQUCA|nr:MADS-box protein AGL73 [Aquilegia coerulea]